MAAKRAETTPIVGMSAVELRDRIAGGALRAAQVAQAFLEQIRLRDPQIQAWVWHDAEFVMHQAAEMDRFRALGRPLGRLHGVPVALKDIIDTARIPTENGTASDAGRIPAQDAVIVARLKAAGAIIMGKTVTAELAYLHPGATTNPHNPDHTPGGSSSGSAAAVAAHMVPLAVGTQTGGSVIRPAAFCGTVGFKPSFGAIPRTGILPQSHTLDTVGVFANSVADAAMLAEVLYGHDDGDRQSLLLPAPNLSGLANSKPPIQPTFAFIRPPGWDLADAETKDAFAELVGALGEHCFEMPLPDVYTQAYGWRETINLAEMARSYYRYAEKGGLSAEMSDALARGNKVPARDYLAALDWQKVLSDGLAPIFERCDAILTPAALGPAPKGLGNTGSAIFNGVWTLCGVPAVTLPLLDSQSGLPMGVQLVGALHNDGRLLRSANWLMGWAQSDILTGDAE